MLSPLRLVVPLLSRLVPVLSRIVLSCWDPVTVTWGLSTSASITLLRVPVKSLAHMFLSLRVWVKGQPRQLVTVTSTRRATSSLGRVARRDVDGRLAKGAHFLRWVES